MKCPECTSELESLENFPFLFSCDVCQEEWSICTIEQSVEMGKLNTELLCRTDLSVSEKTEILLKKAKELGNKN